MRKPDLTIVPGGADRVWVSRRTLELVLKALGHAQRELALQRDSWITDMIDEPFDPRGEFWKIDNRLPLAWLKAALKAMEAEGLGGPGELEPKMPDPLSGPR